MTLQALKQCEFLVTVDYWMTPTALLSDYVFPAAGALERPTIVTHSRRHRSPSSAASAPCSLSTTATPT